MNFSKILVLGFKSLMRLLKALHTRPIQGPVTVPHVTQTPLYSRVPPQNRTTVWLLRKGISPSPWGSCYKMA